MEKGNSGARTEVDEVVSGNREEKRTQILPYIPWNMLGIALLVLLLIVGIIVLLEMQRIVRVFLRSRKRKNQSGINWRSFPMGRCAVCSAVPAFLRITGALMN